MALPASLDTVTVVVGPYVGASGDPATGTVTFTPSSRLLWTATGAVVLEGPVSVSLGSLGTASVVLPATDAAGLNVTGFTYTVDWSLKAGGKAVPVRSQAVALPAAAPSVVLGSLVPAETGSTADVVLPAVLSVAGLSGAIDAADLAAELDPFITGGGATVTIDADGTLVVDGTTVELGTDAEVAAAIAVAVSTKADASATTSALAGKASTTHAATHASAGSDPVTLAQSQVTGLTAALAAKLDTSTATSTYVPLLTPVTTVTYNGDGTVATQTIGGVVSSYTYNGDGTVATETRAGVVRTFTYNGDGTLASVA